jgi:ketosteroid isomerase-like protein
VGLWIAGFLFSFFGFFHHPVLIPPNPHTPTPTHPHTQNTHTHTPPSSLEADARTAVEDANARFYAAFRSGSAAAMADAWGTGDHVQVIHPGGGCIAGRAAVLESWRVVTGGIGLDVILRDVRIHAPPGSPVAVVTCLELVDVGDARGRNVATNVFEWQPDEDAVAAGPGDGAGVVGGPGGGWKLVLHHASPAPRPQQGGGGRRV